jgi:cation diffusion facilitator CzcD-associated flavoprotein CzcO
MHSHSYKKPTKAMKGKTVLVVGGGESASDVAAEVCEKAARTILAIRCTQPFPAALHPPVWVKLTCWRTRTIGLVPGSRTGP